MKPCCLIFHFAIFGTHSVKLDKLRRNPTFESMVCLTTKCQIVRKSNRLKEDSCTYLPNMHETFANFMCRQFVRIRDI